MPRLHSDLNLELGRWSDPQSHDCQLRNKNINNDGCIKIQRNQKYNCQEDSWTIGKYGYFCPRSWWVWDQFILKFQGGNPANFPTKRGPVASGASHRWRWEGAGMPSRVMIKAIVVTYSDLQKAPRSCGTTEGHFWSHHTTGRVPRNEHTACWHSSLTSSCSSCFQLQCLHFGWIG